MVVSHKISFDNICNISKNIVKTLAYFDIFNYPLNREEIFDFTITRGVAKSSVYAELKLLVYLKIVHHIDGFYSLNNTDHYVPRRIEGNRRASNEMKLARLYSKLISHFPYVRAVLLSGSISKGFMDEKADIDYFIITEPNRLWVARFFLVLFNKIFLFNSYKFFCINYFVSTSNLEIEEKNIYTATEFVTLIPTYGAEIYHKRKYKLVG